MTEEGEGSAGPVEGSDIRAPEQVNSKPQQKDALCSRLSSQLFPAGHGCAGPRQKMQRGVVRRYAGQGLMLPTGTATQHNSR